VQQPFQGPEQLTAIWAVPLILLSIGLAAATYKWIENPFRHAAFIKYSGLKSIFFGLSLSLIVAMISALASTQVMRQQAGDNGTEVVASEITNVKNSPEVTKIIDELAPKYSTSDDLAVSASQVSAALDDMPETYKTGCHAEQASTKLPENCSFGPVDSETHIYLFGNSHANMFFTPIREASLDRGARFTSRTRSACSISDVTFLSGESENTRCNSWREDVMKEIAATTPDLVIMSTDLRPSTSILDPETGVKASPERTVALYTSGLQKLIARMANLGINVVLIRDTPRLGDPPLDCLSTNTPKYCRVPVASTVNDPNFSVGVLSDTEYTTPVDLTFALCGKLYCDLVKSQTIVWRDDHHITDTYAKLLSPLFAKLITLEVPSAR
jgi:hypothetical protein